MAIANAKENGLTAISAFHRSDAWNLSAFDECFDVLTSNGLNIYVKDDAEVTKLYQEFFRALRPGGTLITSFLTPKEAWKDVNADDAKQQQVLFGALINAQWQHLRSEETTKSQLSAAGFGNIAMIPDLHGIFLTVVATKPA